MPGIIGYVGSFDESKFQDRMLDRMAEALEPESRFSKELYLDNSIGFGRVSLRIANPEKQPVWNRDRTLCLIMEGELFDYSDEKRNLADRGYDFQTDSDAEFLLHLYEEFGEDAAGKLNGAFVAAIWNTLLQKLTLISDRLGLHPLYYTQTKEGLLFASGVRALLAHNEVDRSIDKIAIAQFLTFDHVLGHRTLLRSVCLMPQGSILDAQDGRITIRSYWTPTHPKHYQLLAEEEWMQLFSERLCRAVGRQSKDDQRIGLLLSGGLDSRYLLANLNKLSEGRTLQTYTWGIPGCDDAKAAKELARLTGNSNQFFELKPDWLLEKAAEAVRITDGMSNIINCHVLANLEEQTKESKILLKGFLGDAMMGFALRPQLWAEYDDETRIQAHLQVHRDQGVITFEFDEQENLFTKSFQEEVGSAVIDTYRAAMDESDTSSLADQRIYFDYRQRVARMTIKGVELARSRAEVRLPFADNDLIDLAIGLPAGWRYERRLMRDAFIREFPELARVPLPDTGLPMMSCLRDVQIRAGLWARWHLNAAGLPVARVKRRPYKDYNTWFRTVLRSWIEETLLSDLALEREYFQPEFIDKIVGEHMGGANNTGKIGALMSLELWHQEFID